VILEKHNQKQQELINSKNQNQSANNLRIDNSTVDTPKTEENRSKSENGSKNDDSGQKNLNSKFINIENPFKEMDYLCDSASENDCEVLNRINMKKMHIMNCYLRFMRLAHIGNGLDIYWRKILSIDIDISYNQYYEMIEYKTSEILVFMIDCLCILHDVCDFLF
jgi:hypothetical protein